MKTLLNSLAEPNRWNIVELLKQGPLTVGEIAERLELRQPQVSKHLRVLSEAGIVVVHPIANRRIYHLNPEPFHELQEWTETYRHLWEDRFNQLDLYLKEAQNKGEEEKPS
ncbi:metalloregulator ArsR/SmtB family transcription factor [Planococcus sp. N028]|uniref:Metalloregulator ArsR/SmtB family transcription factor n=1 Tax=Planococcus shixiaomingii TaxID=3058393 RepID=A0ABT8N4Z0_9BACL|nr:MULTISPECIES: metalloregulator ArsR/SmtB family transcription factor [unclassified Planococcus (in: firmicutes)]MDN7242707.1 metalloregulator ArsR/SmtB family transcription factor [Planococcus sp. N028]WKA55665.1 metalloregulator ArsR/SmtB family transcription factor [Planococcus sp. N022]